jgi:hypothetical protein
MHLLDEPLDHLRVRQLVLADHLQGHVPPEPRVAGLVHPPHSPFAEQVHQHELADEQVAGFAPGDGPHLEGGQPPAGGQFAERGSRVGGLFAHPPADGGRLVGVQQLALEQVDHQRVGGRRHVRVRGYGVRVLCDPWARGASSEA